MRFEPLKNYRIIEWCKSNRFELDILKFNHLDQLKRIRQHFEEVGVTGRADARICYDLSYRPYMNSIYALRNIHSHSRRFLTVAKKYKEMWRVTERYVQWLPLWDSSIMMFEEKARKENYLMKKIDVEDSTEYPLHIGNKTFFPCLIMWTFVGKNWDDICSNRWTKGPIFEARVEQELCDRDVKMIDKNIRLTPDDEVDVLCEKDGMYYMIEAKNYGPNWEYNFLGSSTYEKRVEEMNFKISLAPRRLRLIDASRERFGIPAKAKLQGIIVTSFVEPHVRVPEGFRCLNVDKLSKVFGKKMTLPEWEKRPVFQIPEGMLSEIHRRMEGGTKH